MKVDLEIAWQEVKMIKIKREGVHYEQKLRKIIIFDK